MCLAQEHDTVTPVRLEPAAPLSRVKHSTTVLPTNISVITLYLIYKCTYNTMSFTEFVTLYILIVFHQGRLYISGSVYLKMPETSNIILKALYPLNLFIMDPS